MPRKPPIEADDLSEFLPHGCTCKDSETAVACARCRNQRDRIRTLYDLEYRHPDTPKAEEVTA